MKTQYRITFTRYNNGERRISSPMWVSAKSGAMVRSDAVERAKRLGWREEA